MRDLLTLAVMVAILGAIFAWQRRRHPDVESDARRAGLMGASSSRQSVLQLARAEVRFLHRHPATLVGLVMLLPLGISLNVSSGERIDLGVGDIDAVPERSRARAVVLRCRYGLTFATCRLVPDS